MREYNFITKNGIRYSSVGKTAQEARKGLRKAWNIDESEPLKLLYSKKV